MEEISIDRYKVKGSLGAGANGHVYLGFDPKLEREVAIKVVHPELASREDVMARFHREARAIARLHHPNILEIYDYSGPSSALGYLVVERLHGRNLEELIVEKGPLDVATAAAAVHEICLALAHAHAIGIVHRDLKPENVFLEPSGRVVLCDFGIARSFDKSERGTLAGRETEMMGTPLFMSPEQITDPATVSGASDVFSLGGVLFHLVTGDFAFRARTLVEVLQKIVISDHERLVDHGISASFSDIVEHCLCVEAADRPSAQDVAKSLLEVMQAAGVADPRSALHDIAQVSEGARPVKPIDRNDEVSRTIIGTALGTVAGTNVIATPVPPKKPWRLWPVAVLALVLAVGAVVTFTRKPLPRVVVAASEPVEAPPPAPVVPVVPETIPEPAAPVVTKKKRQPPQVSPSHVAPPAPAATGPGTLRLVATPWADVFIDERKVGTTPIFRTTPLAPGKHTIRLVNPAFPAQTKQIDITSGDSLDVKVDLARGGK